MKNKKINDGEWPVDIDGNIEVSRLYESIKELVYGEINELLNGLYYGDCSNSLYTIDVFPEQKAETPSFWVSGPHTDDHSMFTRTFTFSELINEVEDNYQKPGDGIEFLENIKKICDEKIKDLEESQC